MPREARKFRVLEFKGPKGLFRISPDLCKGCGLCLERCPHDVIDWSEELGVYGSPMATPARIGDCIACGICQMVCPDAAILITKNKKGPGKNPKSSRKTK